MIDNNQNQRYEIKYVLNDNNFNEALNFLYLHSKAKKKFNIRTVNSLYFDDDNLSLAKDNLDGLSNRKKLRLRWYNQENNLNFEIKTKKNRFNSKKIFPINILKSNIQKLKIKEINELCKKEIFNSRFEFYNFHKPILGVKYEREYFENFEGIRITIDKKIKFFDIYNNRRIDQMTIKNYNFKILEIKFHPELLPSAKNIIKKFKILSMRNSKYLTGLNLLNYLSY